MGSREWDDEESEIDEKDAESGREMGRSRMGNREWDDDEESGIGRIGKLMMKMPDELKK